MVLTDKLYRNWLWFKIIQKLLLTNRLCRYCFFTDIVANPFFRNDTLHKVNLLSICKGTFLNCGSYISRSGKLTLCNEGGGHWTTSKVSCLTQIRQQHVQSRQPQYDVQCPAGVRTRKSVVIITNIDRSNATVARVIYKLFKALLRAVYRFNIV
jgi:hypothetical protein